MRTFCEIASKTLIPSLRALIASILIEKYKMTQVDVARKLGITQPAISYYLRSKRGKQALDILRSNEKIMKLVAEMADKIYREDNTEIIYKDFCSLCSAIRSDEEIMKFIEEHIFKKNFAKTLE